MRSNKNRLALIASLSLEDSTLVRVNAIWTKYETGIRDSIRRHGSRHTLNHYKECYVFLRNTTLQLSTQPIPWCKTDSNGIPKTLWPLRSLIKGDRESKRMALTIARSYELITMPIDYNPESIEESQPYRPSFQETTKEFKQWLKHFTQKYPWYLGSLRLRTDQQEPHVFTTLSSGPNGPAVSCAHLDARAVVDDPILYSSISKLNDALGQSWITHWMDNMARTIDSSDSYITGKLGFSAEPGGKTRVFAIADYWSQTSLKVIQDSLYNTLRSISTDSTADQDKGFKSLLEMSDRKSTYCFDLTAASDRLPANLQKFRLELLGGHKLGEAWLSVMTERSFLVKETNKKLRWKVGQPLGLLSSFPSFSLFHHDIVQFAYSRCRSRKGLPLKFFKDYRLLGDDIVILNKEVADEYQFLIKDVFGLTINMTKSVIGDSRNSQIEFTKRLALKGKEMSSIKRNILTKNDMQSMLDLIDILLIRDFISKDTGHYGLYSFLSSKEQAMFNFMLWVRSDCGAPFKGLTPPCLIERETFNKLLLEKRSQNLMEKTALIDKYFNEAKPLDELYKQSSVPYNERALGLKQLHSNHLELHPLVWAINQTGLDLSIALSQIWDEQSPDVAPVEYLPIVSTKSYFHTPRKRSIEFLAGIILDVYNELSNETQPK
jgi:hypothetical protein